MRLAGLHCHIGSQIYRLDSYARSVEIVTRLAAEIAGESGEPIEELNFGGGLGVRYLSEDPEVDVVVSAVVGAAGLTGTWAALEAGKTVALANKETLVVAGPLVMELAARRHAAILPVDSEHNAVFQALTAGRRGN